MVLAKGKCGLYDCFPVVLQIGNHGRVSLMVLGWSAGRDTGGSLPLGESNIEGFEVTEDDDATLNLIPFPFC